MKTVIVASTNPVKIEAVRLGFAKMFPKSNFEVRGIAISSDVGDQPRSDKETQTGALSRVTKAKHEIPSADFWVGIEGGASDAPAAFDAAGHSKDICTMEGFAWIVVISRNGMVGKGRTGTYLLPPQVSDLIRSGKELGEADDIVFHQKNSKQKMGSVGLLTGGAIDRTAYYTDGVVLALIPFKNPNLYK